MTGLRASLRGISFVCGLGLLCLSTVLTAAEPMSIQELMARRPQWDKLVGANLVVEGRFLLNIEKQLRLVGSDLNFLLEDNVEFRRDRDHPQVIVSGELEPHGNGFRFRVMSAAVGPAESTVVRDRLQKGDPNDPERIAEQGDWVAGRAKFYSDPELKRFAEELYERSIRLARSRLASDDSMTLLALAGKAEKWGLAEDFRFDLLHMASRAELNAESRKPRPDYARVRENLKQRFASAAKPLPGLPEKLLQTYESNPLGTYEAASAETRAMLHRLLYLETGLREVRLERQADGSNGLKIATFIDTELPEHGALAVEEREAAFRYHEGQLAKMTREEMLEFKAVLRQHNETTRESRVVKRWIDSRYAGLPDTPANRVRRATDEFDVAGDPATALTTLAIALRLDPNAPGAAELLERLGYAWHESQLITRDRVPAPKVDKTALAIREGRILVGMTDAQVRATLGGEPESVIRLASQGTVTELWHYPDQRLTLALSLRRTHPAQSQPLLTVQRIIELAQ